MRHILFIIFHLFFLGAFGQSESNLITEFDFYSTADLFFKNHCQNNQVNYSAAKNDQSLDELVKYIETHDIIELEEKAFLINAYNLIVIHKIVQNRPFQPTNFDPAFFTEKSIVVNGKNVSLNDIENKLLRKKYNDARMHFALVCGAVGCPPIANFAYRPEKLNEQLTQRVKQALSGESFLYERPHEKSLYTSKIIQWYRSDFGKTDQEIIQYLNQFRIVPLNDTYKIKHFPYNWDLNTSNNIPEVIKPLNIDIIKSPNLQYFTAGSLLSKGKMDFTLFNSLYTESKNNWLGTDYSGYRTSFLTHLFQYTIGVTKNKRVNIGFDLSFRSSGRSLDSTINGVSQVFAYKNNDSSRVGITNVGLRVKIQPFKNVYNFTLQSTLSIPTIEHPEGLYTPERNLFWADWDRVTFWNQFFYTKNFSKFQLFTEFDMLFRFKKSSEQIGMLDTPISAFLSYFPTSRVTVYAMTQHVHRFTNDIDPNNSNDWVIPSNYTASGLGFKYQVLKKMNLELLYTNFWRGTNSGLGSTFNIGIKYLP